MELLAHRGYWKTEEQKNTKAANDLAFNNNWGIETDIRDYQTNLIVSHDIGKSNEYLATHLFNQYKKSNCKNTLALNIKADGLSVALKEKLIEFDITNYFVFDMSIPETLRYLQLQMNVFIRCSEYEIPNQVLYSQSQGIWLDCFKNIWYNEAFINKHLDNKKKIAFVSPELHQRSEIDLWNLIKQNNWHLNSNIMLCTDFPDKAKIYFNL